MDILRIPLYRGLKDEIDGWILTDETVSYKEQKTLVGSLYDRTYLNRLCTIFGLPQQ